MKKVLLLGGTGAMGIYLQELLSDNGYEVTVTSRSERTSENANIKFIQGNALDDDFIDEVLSLEWDGIVDFMVYSTSSFEEKIERLLNSTRHYIYLSSARVYADSKDKITENSPRLLDVSKDSEFLATDEYALAKAKQENVLFSCNAKNWTIVRPYITYGDNRLQLGGLEKESWLYRALKGKTIVFSKEMCDKRTTITSGYDVAKAISSLLGKESTLGEVFHITSNESTSWQEVLTLYCEEIEKKLGIMPKILLQDLQDFSSHHTAIHQIRYDRVYNRTFDNSKIDRFINVGEFTSHAEGLKACLNTFVSNGKFLAINWRSEAIKDKYAGEYTRLSEIHGAKNKLKYVYFRFIK